VILCEGDVIAPHHLPPGFTAPPPSEDTANAVVVPLGTTVDEAEKHLILKTLAAAGHNKAKAASILGISIKTLHNKLHRYGR
jgi:DNA-binding NtrC family response regulator